MEACSQKMPTNNRWAKEALISKAVTDAEVASSLKNLDETNLVACQTYYKLFKDALPKDKVQDIIDRIKVEYLAYLEENLENKKLYSTSGVIITI